MTENRSFDDRLMEAARGLEKEATPARDLWPAIEGAISKPSRTRSNTAFAKAAAVLLLIGASSGLTYLAMQDDAAPITPLAANRGLDIERASFGGRYVLGPDYQDARTSLKAQLDERLDDLPPEVRAEVEKNLATIREAIDEINAALADEPDNALLQELLLGTYREELSLMMRVGGVASAVMYRTDI